MAADSSQLGKLSPEEFLHGIEVFNFHLSPEEKRILSEEIASLEKDGIIQQQESDYKNQIHLNKDPNDPYKLVIDLSDINGYLDKYDLIVPKPKTVWPRFRNKKYISTVKVNRAYYQVQLAEEQQPHTGFMFEGKQYVFNRLTPGVYGCEDMLQGVMQRMFEGMPKEKVFVYLETIYIFGETEDEHRSTIRKVLNRLKGGSMTANMPNPDSFYQSSVELLGHKISNNKLEMLDSKLQTVEETECPKTLMELFEFMDEARFYRDMIKGFSVLAAPLTDFFYKPRPLTGDLPLKMDQEKCIEELRKKLLMKPVLAIFDQNAEIILHVSASKIAIEGDLYQVDPTTQEKQAVGYFSQNVMGGKKNWDLFELELLAIAESFQYFQEYLKKCAHFSMRPESLPMVYAQKFQSPSDRLKKLRSRIRSFAFNFDEPHIMTVFKVLLISDKF